MWQKDIYPSPADLQDAISARTLYIGCVDDRIAAAMVINQNHNAAYEKAKWTNDFTQEEYLVIHMLGVHSDFARRGFAKQMVHFALDHARAEYLKAVRLDGLRPL